MTDEIKTILGLPVHQKDVPASLTPQGVIDKDVVIRRVGIPEPQTLRTVIYNAGGMDWPLQVIAESGSPWPHNCGEKNTIPVPSGYLLVRHPGGKGFICRRSQAEEIQE